MARISKTKIVEIGITAFIAVLIITTSIAWFSDYKKEKRDERRIADFKIIQKGLVSYFSEHRSYPEQKEIYTVIADMPQDPLGGNYMYERVDQDSYVLGTCLENTRSVDLKSYAKADAESFDVVTPLTKCTCASINAYCVNQDL